MRDADDRHPSCDPPAPAPKARRDFLKCMAWAGAGTLWFMQGGVLQARSLSDDADSADAARNASFSFVQVSDSHIGFNKAPNPDVAGTLKTALERINAEPGAAQGLSAAEFLKRRWKVPLDADKVGAAIVGVLRGDLADGTAAIGVTGEGVEPLG